MTATLETEPPHPQRSTSRKVRESLLAAAVLLPSAVIFVAFFFYPLYRLVWLSIHQQNQTGTAERLRTEQLVSTLTGEEFRSGLGITASYVLYTVPLGLILGTLLAVAAHRRLKGIRIFQTIFASTIASSVAVASVIFLVLINPAVGYFSNIGFFSLADPDTALRGVALSSVWQNLGLSFIIVLAALQTVPDELMEAATLDGFGPFRRFFRVTVPLISPALLFLAIVLVVFAMQAFGQVDILTSGGPNRSTETLVWKIFDHQQPAQAGVGSAMALGLFAVTLLITVAQFVVLERRVHYGS